MTKCTLCVDRIYDEDAGRPTTASRRASRPARPARACSATSRIRTPRSRSAIRERGGYALMPEWQTRAGEPVPAAAHHRGRRRTTRADVGDAGHRPRRPRRRRRPSATRRAMNPAFSVVVFTTLAGAAQGLVVAARARACWRACRCAAAFVGRVCSSALVAARRRPGVVVPPPRPARACLARRDDVAHLVAVARGHRAAGVHRPGRACGGWRRAEPVSTSARLALPLAAIAVAALLWYCTAMIYACLRFIEEWAQPLTVVNFVLLGLSSGLRPGERAGGAGGESRAARARGAAGARRHARRLGVAHRVAAPQRHASAIARPCNRRPASARARLAQKSMGMSAARSTRASSSTAPRAAALRQDQDASPSCSASRCPRCCWRGSPSARCPPRVRRRAGRAGAGPGRRALVLLRAGEAPAEPVLPGGVLMLLSGARGQPIRRRLERLPDDWPIVDADRAVEKNATNANDRRPMTRTARPSA